MALVIASLILAFFAFWFRPWSRNHPPYPPGPPPDPFIGHLRRLPPDHAEDVFHDWAKIYGMSTELVRSADTHSNLGDVIHLRYLGRSVVILDSVQAAIDLLDKRGSNYSSRPKFIIFELMGWIPTLTFLQNGTKQFRKHRRLLQLYFARNACLAFRPSQMQEARVLLKNLISSHGNHDQLLSRFSTSVIIRIAYGHRITSDKDKYIQILADTAHALTHCGPPGNTPVDLFPFLQYLPRWFPGTKYAQFARDWKGAIRKLHDIPFATVQAQRINGTAEPSFTASQLDALTPEEILNVNEIEDIKGAAAAIYTAGAETIWSTLAVFILAMVIHPECQKIAQNEIDGIVGNTRLPEFSDRDSLPYVECILQEILRLYAPGPLGVPHLSTEDDVYKGMFIPKGSLVFANIKGMGLDEETYAEPYKFYPARFLPQPIGNGEPHSRAGFGFGRRICPGRYFADSGVWITIVSILSTLEISRVVGEDGHEIIPEFAFDAGLISHPKPFECIIRPRSRDAESLILRCNAMDAGSA